MSYGDLKQSMADLTNSFQNGSFAASLSATMNISVNTMATQEPLYVPQPEDFADQCIPQDDDPELPCYLSAEDNKQDGIPWSEASQANATARLEESLTDTVLQTPTELVIGSTQPFTAAAGSPMDPKPTLYMKDQNGDTVNQVGTLEDPWIVTASLLTGSGNLEGNVTCEFKQGLCVFEKLVVTEEGEGYSIQFDLTYPGTETVIIPAVSELFDVEARKLSAKFTELATLNPLNTPFPAVVTIWDDATDMPADPSEIPADITCSVTVISHNDVQLNGTTDGVPVVDGEAVFALESEEVISNAKLGANCENPSLTFQSVAISDYFNVHPYPKTGAVRDATAAFTYDGTINEVNKVLSALADIVGATIDTSNRRKRSVEEKTTFAFSEEELASWPTF